MNNRVRNKLIHFCRVGRGSISLPQLIYDADLGLNLEISHERSRLIDILNDISTKEHEQGRPLLSGMVKIKTKGGQGDQFYRMCENLGLGEWRELKGDADFIKEVRREARRFWRNEENYEKYFDL
ncbi:hypothetical protein SAMN05421823_10826 [Catalinimonas alkaloidigena]|uniref:Uncharacterized protein n=1 Tax=Catalinimonas alkaloidigena TaxID=1075417 RepID=A0A1G9MM00_9BACT|nr:hypothetical protein [Catalinimonas alkaloidigena]SDL75302.1 hypothetical protein SAMN05421823_10826 [Catalinimonas alkaloidigena]